MAQVTVVTLVDDLDSSVRTDVETVVYHVAGREYRIDLGIENRAKLEEALRALKEAEGAVAGFTSRSRPVHKLPAAGAPRRGSGARKRPDAGKVRTWAIANGIDVSARGRLPFEVIDQYIAANRDPSTDAESAGNTIASALAAIQARAVEGVPHAS